MVWVFSEMGRAAEVVAALCAWQAIVERRAALSVQHGRTAAHSARSGAQSITDYEHQSQYDVFGMVQGDSTKLPRQNLLCAPRAWYIV